MFYFPLTAPSRPTAASFKRFYRLQWAGRGRKGGGHKHVSRSESIFQARLLITNTFKVWVLLENGSSNDCQYEFMSAVVMMSPEQDPVK